MTQDSLPICVDLDGTLSRTDTLWECFLAALKNNWLFVFIAPIKALQSKSAFKGYLVKNIGAYSPCYLIQEDLMEYLVEQKEKGRRLYLATGSHEAVAQKVADHTKIFDKVFATNNRVNLISHRKAELLRKTFPEGFVYAGNSSQDLEVWKASKEAILVNTPAKITALARKNFYVSHHFGSEPNQWRNMITALNIKHWFGNLIILGPLVLTSAKPVSAIFLVLLGLVALCLSSSAVYIANDLLNLDADRRDNIRKARPFASGKVDISTGCVMFLVLMFIAVLISWSISPAYLIAVVICIILELKLLRSKTKRNTNQVLATAIPYLLKAILGLILIS